MVSHYPEKPKNKRKPQRYRWVVPILVLAMGVALALFSASYQEPYEYEASATELYHTAMRLQAQGQYEASIDVFTQSIAMDKGFTDMFYVDRGVSYAYLGEDDLAQADYLHTLNYINDTFDEVVSDPHFTIADYYNNRGYTYIMLGDYEKAIADLDRAIAIEPDYAYAYNNRGRAYFYLGDMEQALTDHNRSQELDSGNNFVYKWRGHLYFELGSYDLALADYQRYETIMGGLQPWMAEQIDMMEDALENSPQVREFGMYE